MDDECEDCGATLGDAPQYQVAELTADRARYWLAMDGWTADEAAHLLLGVAPNPELLRQVARVNAFELVSTVTYERLHRNYLNLLERAGEASTLRFPAKPADVIAWAASKKMRLPACFIAEGQEVQDGEWFHARARFGPPNGATSEELRNSKPSAMPHFVTSARPPRVPLALLALPDDAQISYEVHIGRENGNGIGSAADYREVITKTIARQAKGYFTLNEAAQVLADSAGLDPLKTVQRFLEAHSKGELPIHECGSHFPLDVGETVNDLLDTVKVDEVDAWLRSKVDYGFPMADGASQPTPEVRASLTQEFAPGCGKPAKRWTPEVLELLKQYRAKHGTKAAAAHFNISEQRVRELLPKEKPAPTGYSAFNPRRQ